MYHQRDFPRLRAEYLQGHVGAVEEDCVLAVNVLLSFKIARRVDEFELKYPLTRSEVKKAIEYVMSFNEEEYKQKVILIYDLLCIIA